MAFELSLKLNNQTVDGIGSSIRIIDEFPTLNWEFDLTDRAVVDISTGVSSSAGEFSQNSYEVRVSNSSSNVGLDSFVGNMAQPGSLDGQEAFWRYNGTSLDRGTVYYGQVRAIDSVGRVSDWATFSFLYNSLPAVTNVVISPAQPSVTDDILLDYDYSDADVSAGMESGTKIRWFKNGVYQKQFDDALIIESFNLQNNEIWNADVYPSDGYEFGSRVTSLHVIVSKTSVTVSDISILPENPNPDDMLKANYLTSDNIEQENVLIRWYINDFLTSEFNDQQYVKLPVVEGDSVRFEVKQIESGTYVSSSAEIIVASDYVISNIVVDGKVDSLDISSTAPLVQWNTFVPEGKTINYISIKIGTFFESDNIYSTTLSYSGDSFTIPHKLLNKGMDYYISIAASDTQVFSKYFLSHFRINGSRWEKTVSNSIGWTFEMFFSIPIQSDGVDPSTDYQIIRINDGSRFAEIRLYSSKIVLISGSRMEYEYTSTFNANTLNISGIDDNIKIYLDKEIIIDGAGIFTQMSNIKRLEIGSSSSETFLVHYRYLFYTTSGYFLPGVDDEYSNIQFHNYMEFEDNEVVALNSYTGGKYVFGLNPNSTVESSTVLAIVPGKSTINCPTVPRTFSPINRINKSPDDKIAVYAHSKGATVIKGYVINPFNHELIFVDGDGVLDETLPTSSGWELVKNISVENISVENVSADDEVSGVYFDTDGFHIDTIG